MKTFVRITACLVGGTSVLGCWTVGQALAPDATSALSLNLKPHIWVLAPTIGLIVWFCDKVFGPLIEALSDRLWGNADPTTSQYDTLLSKLDHAEAEVEALRRIAERAIFERDAALKQAQATRLIANLKQRGSAESARPVIFGLT